MKIEIPHRPIHIGLFLLLAFLCYQAHQLVRHVTGAILCGGLGTMTFTVSTARQPCSLPTVVTLSGPVLTYGLAALGVLLLRRRRTALLGYALIFASFVPLRFIQTLTGRGDELVLAQQWFGVNSRVLVAAVVFLVGLVPALAAFRSIGNPHRYRVWFGTWLLPIPVLFMLLVTGRLLFGENGDVVQMPTILGIAWIVLVIDLLALLLFAALAPRHLNEPPFIETNGLTARPHERE